MENLNYGQAYRLARWGERGIVEQLRSACPETSKKTPGAARMGPNVAGSRYVLECTDAVHGSVRRGEKAKQLGIYRGAIPFVTRFFSDISYARELREIANATTKKDRHYNRKKRNRQIKTIKTQKCVRRRVPIIRRICRYGDKNLRYR